MKNKILVIVGSLSLGGTETHLSQVLVGLVEKGWQISLLLLTDQKNDCLVDRLRRGQVELLIPKHFKLTNKIPKFISRPFAIIRSISRIIHYSLKNKQAITHLFLPSAYYLGMFAQLLMKNQSYRVMSRRSLNHYFQKRFVSQYIEKFLHTRCHKILGNSEAVLKQLNQQEKVPLQKLKLIYNGLSNDQVDERTSQQALQKQENTVFLVQVANLIPYKGHIDLLESLALIKNELVKSWQLLLIGYDSGIWVDLQKVIEKHNLQQHVRWLGQSQNVSDLLKSCDIGILVSHEEGFSNAILEYMRAGLAVIATDVGGNSEAVIEQQTGLLVEKQNKQSIAQAIKCLVLDDNLRKAMGKAGRARFEKYFTLEKCVDEYHKFYKSLMQANLSQ